MHLGRVVCAELVRAVGSGARAVRRSTRGAQGRARRVGSRAHAAIAVAFGLMGVRDTDAGLAAIWQAR